MSKPLAERDRIRVKDRDQVAADIKSQLFYEHYRNLTGTIAKIYPDGTASVFVDNDSLTKEIAQRHGQTSDTLRQRWLESMSEEGRGRLGAAEKSFALRYTILIAVADLESLGEKAPSLNAPAKTTAQIAAPVEEPARKTLADLEAEEAKHLEELQNRTS